MRNIIEVDRLWLVLVVAGIAVFLTVQTVYTIFIIVVDDAGEIVPFLIFSSISILQGGAVGYLIAFFIISKKFLKYDNLIIKSKKGMDYFNRNLKEEDF